MTPPDDYPEDMSGVDEIGIGADRPRGRNSDTAAVTRFLADLSALAEVDAPPLTPELEAIMGGSWRAPRSSRRTVLRAGLAAAAAAAGLVTAAAHHRLPTPAQRMVSDVVDTVTPFHIGTDTSKPPVLPRPAIVPPVARPSVEQPETGIDEGPQSSSSSTESGPADDGGSVGAPGSRRPRPEDVGGEPADPAGEDGAAVSAPPATSPGGGESDGEGQSPSPVATSSARTAEDENGTRTRTTGRPARPSRTAMENDREGPD